MKQFTTVFTLVFAFALWATPLGFANAQQYTMQYGCGSYYSSIPCTNYNYYRPYYPTQYPYYNTSMYNFAPNYNPYQYYNYNTYYANPYRYYQPYTNVNVNIGHGYYGNYGYY